MTGDFSVAVATMLKGDAVGLTYGVTFDFRSGPVSLWQGFGDLDASGMSDGHGGTGPLFKGIGALGTIGPVEIGTNAQTQGITFELSGVEARYSALSHNQASELNGRRVRLYLLFFNPDGSLLDLRLRRTMVMDQTETQLISSTNPPTMKVILSTETVLAEKAKSRFAFLTDLDQRARYPGDRSLERVGETAANTTIIW